MFKLANQVIDVYDDVEKIGIRKIAALGPRINVMSPEEHAGLKDHDFALSVITKKASKLNKFPINSFDNTWLSNHYFDMNHMKLPKTAAQIAAVHIKKASERFSIKPLESILKVAASVTKEASSNAYYEGTEHLSRAKPVEKISLDKFAAVRDISDNYTHAQYAMKTPAHVKVACAYFEEKHGKMPLEYRHKYAAAIQRRAKELGMPVQEGRVAKYASDHYSGQVDAHIRSRLSLLETAPAATREGFEKMAAAKKELTPSQFAQMLHALDKKAGLSNYYGSHLQDPYLATFGKEPDPYAAWRFKTASMNLQADDLRVLAAEKYAQIKNYFGSSIADEFKRSPVEIFDSLPNDAKEILAGIAAGTC